ncbi:MAG: ABC transporter permease, partial [Planctomycetes bacterium]|nr:ABC transporter permease [Planctomycetota bacterium]
MRLALIRENVRLGLAILGERKFRSFLTIVGVLIGVIIIVAVASVLNGFRASVIRQIEEFGTNNIYIFRFPFIHVGRPSRSLRRRKPLTLEDAWAIRDHCPSVRVVAPGLQAPGTMSVARYRGRELEAPQFRGNFPESLEVGNAEIEEGRYFTAAEASSAARVAVIGTNVRDALFPSETPIGKRITVGGAGYRVIGLLAKHREGPFGEQNHEDSIIAIPYSALTKRFPWLDDHFIAAQAYPGKLSAAIDEIEEILRRRRRVKWNEPNDFEIGTADSIIESFDSIVFAVLAGMFSLSTVAFLVGGVGVMNI